MPRTLTEKLAADHAEPGSSCRPGEYIRIRPRHVMTHDNTASVLSKFRSLGVQAIHDRAQPVIALDHDIQNQTPENLGAYARIEAFARQHRLAFYPAGSGIGHQIMIERGFAAPGSLVVASDSHANMYGAVGCLGTPVVRTDAAAIWATGVTWWRVPPVARVMLRGRLSSGVTGKDIILALCGIINSDQVLNHAVEFAGGGLASLSMPDRLTIANMTTEWGALSALFPVDSTTISYLRSRGHLFTESDCPTADPDATYAVEIDLDLSTVPALVTGPNDVKIVTPARELENRRIRVTKAYILSCVNARYEDLAQAAGELRRRRVASHVELYIAAASASEQQRAERDGHWKTLLDAGAIPLPSGCGPCIGLGQGIAQAGDVVISATNRNYRGRMGHVDAQVYLASPAAVAASAREGFIAAPTGSPMNSTMPQAPLRAMRRATPAESPALVDNFPRRLAARSVLLPQNDISTDAIYAGKWTYRNDLTREQMAAAAFENYDAQFQSLAISGDVIVAGRNFGTGSSREQAATALQAFGIRAIIAASFSATYERNALNNGLLLLESPDLADFLFTGCGSRVSRGPDLAIDFERSVIETGGHSFPFAPLGPVAQRLIISGGIEQQLRAALAQEINA
ncbi:MAG: aconitase family protein [Phycisphaerales bacterium]|nr:homoaconitase [Planctomycetota bacterium]